MGDLRHTTIGMHVSFMPIAIGYIGAYTIAEIGKENLDVYLETDITKMLDKINTTNPDVLALSNYIWNHEINQMVFQKAKELNPEIICIAGGPEFPRDHAHGECLDFLLKYPNIDFFAYREGEIPFAKLIKRILEGDDVLKLKSIPQVGIMSIHPKSNTLVAGPASERLMDMDVIPSPYLEGMMDKFFDGVFKPFIESARGCPYQCTFCDAGASWYNKVAGFSVERIREETEYIAERIKQYPFLPLALADSNFGMLKRDEVIADHIGSLQKKYGWPMLFNVSTGKSQLERIIRVAQKMSNNLVISLSVQSMNEDTLDIVKRKNLGDTSYNSTADKLQDLGINTYSDMILPLPGESKETFFDGFRKLSQANIQKLVPFTPMMLVGTEMASPESREKYGMNTKFRILPRQFGEYGNNKCFEIEEVCISTNTMSFSDYLECRGFAFITKLFSVTEFDFVVKHLKELEIDRFEFLYALWEKIYSSGSKMNKLYEGFIQETRNELFESAEEATHFYSKQENYDALLRGEIGDNLMQKYTTKSLIDYCVDAISTVYECIQELVDPDINSDIDSSLLNAKKWILATRDLNPVLRLQPDVFSDKYLELDYDIQSWIGSNLDKSLVSYKKKINYQLSLDQEVVQKAITSGKHQYGEDIYFWVPKILETVPVNVFWHNCKSIN